MKSEKHSKIRSAAKYVRIDPYTWIEKRIHESDEVARKRFLNKLARTVNDSHLQPGFNA